MSYIIYSFIFVILSAVGYSLVSIRVISEGNEALVERVGKFNRKLEPGLNFVIPWLESIVVEETNREKVLGIEPQTAITKDNVSLKIDAVVYWQVVDLEKTFYLVEDIQEAIENLVLTTLRSAIGRLDLEETYSSRDEINKTLLQQLDDATVNWGVKVTRVEVREIKPASTVMESLELERAAKSKKRAEVSQAEGTVESIKMIAEAVMKDPNMQNVLQFLIAQRFVEANEQIGRSPNSKIVFMDPKALNEAMTALMSEHIPMGDSGYLSSSSPTVDLEKNDNPPDRKNRS
ncbi:MAG: stomatin-like protein [Jaaginema sp. PMC 1079.18]|nr:stomatin-like protein [Jaaginema sp. PMC 1080.18]MEC4851029.1 stomatin-like protein [Jaaginema sp. PMC 1079.18]MEC4865831.1 stomatin-like protein [Jaaginema sp. PMC 1078.18]